MDGNWRLKLPCTRAEAEAFFDLDDAIAAMDPSPTIVTQETEAFNDSNWEMLAYFDGRPPSVIIAKLQSFVPSASGVPPLLERLENEDWLTMSQQALQPVNAGRFYVHTSDNVGVRPSSAKSFLIEAGQAFGTGGHETTIGCLAMLDFLKRQGCRFNNIVDVGTGTGLLAFAAMHLWPQAFVTASDIDPISVRVTAENAKANQIALGRSMGQLSLCVASGTDHDDIQRRAPYDLVIANILAGPLIELAPALSAILRDSGMLILAGLLNMQVGKVTSAYERAGLRLQRRQDHGDWPCLMLVKRQTYGWRPPARFRRATSQPAGDFGTW